MVDKPAAPALTAGADRGHKVVKISQAGTGCQVDSLLHSLPA
jgi:hypothetical protein